MSFIHLCISTRANQLLRWQQAFPEGRVLADINQLGHYAVSPSVVWIHADSLNGYNLHEIISRITTHENCQRIIVISTVPNQQDTLAALAAGASGYCHALSTPELFKQISLVISNGGLWIGRQLLSQITDNLTSSVEEDPAADALNCLSNREREVAMQVYKGASNKEISSTLNITERTVKAHLSSIFQKLEIRDRLQLILLITT